MNKPYVKPQPNIEFMSATDSVTITTSVERLEKIIIDAMASGTDVNKYLAEKLRAGEVTKTETLETLMYAVALGESSSNSTFH